jgi:hypothetical protein
MTSKKQWQNAKEKPLTHPFFSEVFAKIAADLYRMPIDPRSYVL